MSPPPASETGPDPGPPELIWTRRERAERGPAPSLSREEIAAAAVALADEGGIEAVSMRALAARLGVGATSLYRYVARKEELVDLMVDAAMGEGLGFEPSGEWRTDMRSFARGIRAMILRHPWMAIHGAGRPSLGPSSIETAERVLAAIDGLGLDIDQMLLVIETIDAFVRGRALSELAEGEAIRRSGLDQDQWMASQKPYVAMLVESGLYPLLTRVVFDAEGPHDPNRLERRFDDGLERLLDGLATMLPASP